MASGWPRVVFSRGGEVLRRLGVRQHIHTYIHTYIQHKGSMVLYLFMYKEYRYHKPTKTRELTF